VVRTPFVRVPLDVALPVSFSFDCALVHVVQEHGLQGQTEMRKCECGRVDWQVSQRFVSDRQCTPKRRHANRIPL
jgi:hypothetical protein